MNKDEIIENFKKFFEENKDEAYERISEFLEEQENLFYKNHDYENDIIARQAWVVTVGNVLEEIVKLMLEKFCSNRGLSMTFDDELKKPSNRVLEEVRKNIEIFFDEYSILPDADIVIYSPKSYKVFAILSIKNSFRERYTETPYWKLKLKERESTRNIRVFMITPDKDNEISYSGTRIRKARIVMEYELDGIYLAKSNGFDGSNKVKSLIRLIEDLDAITKDDLSQ